MTRKINFGEPGSQYVTIDNLLAYQWTEKEPLKVGDKVRLPGNYTTGFDTWIGEVTSLGSTWDGHHRDVIGRA